MAPLPLCLPIAPRAAPARLPIVLALVLALGLEALLLCCVNATMSSGGARASLPAAVVLSLRINSLAPVSMAPAPRVLSPAATTRTAPVAVTVSSHRRARAIPSFQVTPGRMPAVSSGHQAERAVASAAASHSVSAAVSGSMAPARASADTGSAFATELRAAVQAALRYPPNARALGLQGKVRVAIGCAGGYCDQATLLQSSGNPWFDRAAVRAVVDARVAAPEERAQFDRYLITVRFELARGAIL